MRSLPRIRILVTDEAGTVLYNAQGAPTRVQEMCRDVVKAVNIPLDSIGPEAVQALRELGVL